MAARDGGDAVLDLFEQRAQVRMRKARAELAGHTLAERVAQFAGILSREGYLAEWQQVDANTFVIYEYNCPLCEVAADFQAACMSELRLLQAVFSDAEVTRDTHKLTGCPSCAYRIRASGGTPA